MRVTAGLCLLLSALLAAACPAVAHPHQQQLPQQRPQFKLRGHGDSKLNVHDSDEQGAESTHPKQPLRQLPTAAEGPVPQDLPTFPNIEYLGLGYNLVVADPFADAADPGFQPLQRAPLLRFTYTEGNTYDNKYAVPDGANVIEDASCSYSSKSYISKSAHALQHSMSTQVSASVGYSSFFFSASASFHSFESSSTASRGSAGLSSVMSTARCTTYAANLAEFGWTPTLDPEFVGAVGALGESLGYTRFLDMFGTHYVSGMQMGGTSTYKAELLTSSLESMTKTGVDISASASIGFIVKAGGSYSTSKHSASYKSFASALSSETLSGIPVPAPSCNGSPMCGDSSAWEAAVAANPQPLDLHLLPVSSLMTPENFPNESNITEKAATVAKLLSNGTYYGTIEGAGAVPVSSCPVGYNGATCSGPAQGTCEESSGTCTCVAGFGGKTCGCPCGLHNVTNPTVKVHNGDQIMPLDRCCQVAGQQTCDTPSCSINYCSSWFPRMTSNTPPNTWLSASVNGLSYGMGQEQDTGVAAYGEAPYGGHLRAQYIGSSTCSSGACGAVKWVGCRISCDTVAASGFC